MNNRRNYYRMLNVQPDASNDVIRASYRALLQKLKLHPDLGGEPWYASHINRAYNVLRNPEKRAAYDKKLLEQYCIKTLSAGGIALKPTQHQTENKQQNQRNYYRILQVQIDSPSALIQSSYQALKKNTSDIKTNRMLDEAFAILAEAKTRQQYDQLLRTHGHHYATEKLKSSPKQPQAQNNPNKNKSRDNINQPPINKTSPAQSKNIKLNAYYQPIIQRYCAFCKTPHNHNPALDDNPLCVECQSPLEPSLNFLQDQAGRNLARLQSKQQITTYHQWPGIGQRHSVLDISPSGLKIISVNPFEIASVIKIDAEDFKAVGEIIYCESHKNAYHVGIRLITAKYQKNKGQFFTARA